MRRVLERGVAVRAAALAVTLPCAALAWAADGPGSWVSVGPTNVGGRITAVAADPNSATHVWIGTAEGGVWTSTDGGVTWASVFDAQSSLSIGSVTAHPTDSSTLFVGTGEDNGGGYSYDGNGVFKTTDGGATWTSLGLAEVKRIGRIAVDPGNPQRLFVAAGGGWFNQDANRGVYRSTDGGTTWQQVLFVDDESGAVDVAIDPSNTSRIYAAIWQRFSAGTIWTIGGANSGIWRSTDGGTTWSRLTNGLPTTGVGRIGLSIAASSPSTVYAVVNSDSGAVLGVYKTTNSGDSWVKTSGPALIHQFAAFGYYFGQIRVDPSDPSIVYALDVNLYRSTDGGQTFSAIAGGVHLDNHDLRILPGGRLYLGTDGGLYTSTDGGTSWTHSENLPITQLYDLGIDRVQPLNRFAGAQDNGTLRTIDGGASDWQAVLGSDGLQCEVDYTNSSNVYAEIQYGAIDRSTNGGVAFTAATSGIKPSERTNWNTPITVDPFVPSTLYTGTIRVYRSTDSAVSWNPVSPDLTNAAFTGYVSPEGSEILHEFEDHLEDLIRDTVTVVSVSPVDNRVLWAGTDDGNVWVSQDSGTTWTEVDPPGLSFWVTAIAGDPLDAHRAYLTETNYRQGDKAAYLRVTPDLGATWQDLGAGLPQLPLNVVRPDPSFPGRLLVGSDVGVHASNDGGATWCTLRGGMPSVVVMDLDVHDPSRTLFAATHGRSIYTYDLGQLPPRPAEVASLFANKGATDSALLSWTALSGSGIMYDVATDDLAHLPSSGTSGAIALACGLSSTSATDAGSLNAGQGVYYLVRGRDVCGKGSWGNDGQGNPRSASPCP